MTDTMELWKKVCVTDPDTTEKVSQKGGFTSVCAQSQIKEATKLWGPYGGKWGVTDIVFGVINDAGGNPLEITIQANFFYPIDVMPHNFPIGSDIAFRIGGDCRKKLLTDITTKALSKLGFNADVFEGLYDDDKYVQELRNKKKTDSPKQDPPENEKREPSKKDKFWAELVKVAKGKITTKTPKVVLSGIVSDLCNDEHVEEYCKTAKAEFPLSVGMKADCSGWDVLVNILAGFDLDASIMAHKASFMLKENKGNASEKPT